MITDVLTVILSPYLGRDERTVNVVGGGEAPFL